MKEDFTEYQKDAMMGILEEVGEVYGRMALPTIAFQLEEVKEHATILRFKAESLLGIL